MIARLSSHEMNLRSEALIASVIKAIVDKYVDKFYSVCNIKENYEDKWGKELSGGNVSLDDLCPI